MAHSQLTMNVAFITLETTLHRWMGKTQRGAIRDSDCE